MLRDPIQPGSQTMLNQNKARAARDCGGIDGLTSMGQHGPGGCGCKEQEGRIKAKRFEATGDLRALGKQRVPGEFAHDCSEIQARTGRFLEMEASFAMR